MNSQIQCRYIQNAQIRSDVENRQISGYGVVFDSDSAPLTVLDGRNGKVRVIERVTQESIKDADMSDVICSYNHNLEKILGRSSSNTASISIDENGILYTVRAGKQTYAEDLIESLDRGDVTGSSFMFTYDVQAGYEFEEREDGTIVATFNKITKIIEMGPVVNPAYPETTAQNRSTDLMEGVKRFLSEKDPIEEILDEVNEDAEAKRALDVEEMASIVVMAFYTEFDGKDNTYYYVKSVMIDNTLVAKEYPSQKLYKLNFSMDEAQNVTFDNKDQWVQVQKEYVAVNRHFDQLEIEKRTKDGTTEKAKTIEYPFMPGYYRTKAKAKKRV